MTDIDQQIEEGIQKGLQEKEEKDRLTWRFITAALFAAIAGYGWSDYVGPSVFPLGAMGIAAVIGFFIKELFAIAVIAMAAGLAYELLLK